MILLWVTLGFLIGSLIEWLTHKYILHNFKIKALSHVHFGLHHKKARRNGGRDSSYETFPPKTWDDGLAEIFMVTLLATLVLPTWFVSPWLWGSLSLHACVYYLVHRKAHLDVNWCKKWTPWHWDHHMGKNQNMNWGITNPLFDYLFRTRQKY